VHTSLDSTIDWQHGRGCAAHYGWLSRHGDHLVRWPAAAFEPAHTDCFVIGRDYWIWQPGLGGLRFSPSDARIEALSERGVDREWFATVVRRSWFPPVYQVHGRQVVHASAVFNAATGEAVAFAGPSGAGKSTLAFGLGRRRGWRHLCDDAMALSAASGEIVLHALEQEPRLRPASADHFGVRNVPMSAPDWPSHSVPLNRIYFLEPRDDEAANLRPISFARLRPADAYQRLLSQAHALTLKIPSLNRRLMLDYLAVTAATPAYRLTYRRSFEHLERIFDVIEDDTTASWMRESVLPADLTPAPAR